MELDIFLKSSREKRTKLLKIAQAFLEENHSNNNPDCLSNNESPDIYSGPTPHKLKLFEEEVGIHLKKIFSPGLHEINRVRRMVNTRSIDETIKETYSRNTPTVKNKQLVIIPKQKFNTTMRIPELLINKKKNRISPDFISEHTNSSVRSESSKIQAKLNRFNKQDLFLPVLTTLGTHEQRSKIYKYK